MEKSDAQLVLGTMEQVQCVRILLDLGKSPLIEKVNYILELFEKLAITISFD